MIGAQIPGAFRDLWTPARYKGYYGGRGSGKSHSVATALVIMAREKTLRVLCCREIQKSMRDSVWRLLCDKIVSCNLQSFYTITETEIRGQNGSLFVFAGLRTNPDSVKSAEGFDIVWVEEAQSISNRSLRILTPTLRKPGSECWFTWNPNRADDPVDVLFRGPKADPRAISKRVNWDDNPWFNETELVGDMEADRLSDPDKYANVWLGEYLQRSEARVFHNWTIQDFATPDTARFYFGADWGFSRDPTVLVRCWIDGRKLFVDKEVVKVGCEIVNTPALFEEGIPGCKKWPIVADSSRPETISHMRNAGFNMISSKKGAGSIEDGVEFLKNYEIKVHTLCRDTSDELAKYSYKIDPHTDEVLPILDDKHNHVIDALRYAVETLRRAQPTAVVGHYSTRR